jgi:hypothetical protein
MILVAILALAGVGALAGALVDQAEPELVGEELSGGGTGPPPPQVDADPTPITGTTGEPVPTTVPTTAPTAAPTPAATPGDGGATGATVVLGGGAVTIPLPEPWQQDSINDDATQATLSTGQGDFAWAGLYTLQDPNADAAVELAGNYLAFLPPEYYTQLQTSEVEPREPFGSMLSLAVLAYQGMWVDSQSTFPLFGNLWAGVNQQGEILFMSVEGTPPERFDTEAWRPVLEGAYQSFAQP